DYIARATVSRHVSWTAFEAAIRAPIHGPSRRARLVLLTTRADTPHTDFAFEDGDILLFGRESAGVPEEVHGRADARLRIPIAAGTRSLNLAASVAIVSAAALSHLDAWPMMLGP
ncbi:MAG: TrmH family RNA methyltransferase, partial [Pseudomonadota bacterium]